MVTDLRGHVGDRLRFNCVVSENFPLRRPKLLGVRKWIEITFECSSLHNICGFRATSSHNDGYSFRRFLIISEKRSTFYASSRLDIIGSWLRFNGKYIVRDKTIRCARWVYANFDNPVHENASKDKSITKEVQPVRSFLTIPAGLHNTLCPKLVEIVIAFTMSNFLYNDTLKIWHLVFLTQFVSCFRFLY